MTDPTPASSAALRDVAAERARQIAKGYCHLQGVRYNAKPCAAECELGNTGPCSRTHVRSANEGARR